MKELHVAVEGLTLRQAAWDHELAPGIHIGLDPLIPGEDSEQGKDPVGKENRQSPLQGCPVTAFDRTPGW
jgi:hypothetical protein